MKRIELLPPGRPVPSPLGGEILFDGPTVYFRRARTDKPARSIRCIGCVHLRTEEISMGIRKSSCEEGHLRNSRDQWRWHSLHELLNPTRELAATAGGCTDYGRADHAAA